jgi:ribonuclease HI
VLLRARQFRVALLADITAFYHPVGVAKQYQWLQRFVHSKFGSEERIQTYQFTTLIFGAICSSSATVFMLQHAADQYAKFPQVAKRIKDNFYSDNMIDSLESDGEATDFAQAVIESLESGGFKLTTFASSSAAVLSIILCHHRSSKQVDLNLDNEALSEAYAAVAYLRAQFKDKVTVSFVMAEGRLAPLKPTTIPRLELRAAVLAVKLSLIIKAELRIRITAVEYHSDSQIVLHQLHSSSEKTANIRKREKRADSPALNGEKLVFHS